MYYTVNELKTCVTFINHEVTSLQSFFFSSLFSFFSTLKLSDICDTYPTLYKADTIRGKVKQTFYIMPGAHLIFAGEPRILCVYLAHCCLN